MSNSASSQQAEGKSSQGNAEKVSKRFGSDSSNDTIIFRSSDNVLFYIQPKHLEVYAEGFPLARNTSLTAPDEHTQGKKEVISLKEKSTTLELLFQFMIPESPPDLEFLGFKQLLDLAEASEKYVVYGARRICALHLRDFVSTNTEKVFTFAAKHNHPSLLFALAPFLVMKPLEEIGHLLPPDVLVPWGIYQANFLKITNNIANVCYINTELHKDRWHSKAMAVREKILQDPSKLSSFRTLLETETSIICDCTEHCNPFKEWRDKICKEINDSQSIKDISLKYQQKKYGNKLPGTV
ncbi:hypothetical protein VKT23_017456 [Stygiomarasmius scandens]|uniref:BTB domain-containing protein n=1 Tax=Marasmiellus scandens TaxID=2682957 RepID=A0ABR1IVY5_9AGAR